MLIRFYFPKHNPSVRFLAMLVLLAGLQQVVAQPIIVSSVPANGATDVSPSAAVVFTFSTAMDTTATAAQFIDSTVPGLVSVLSVWSAGDTVLTCTPSPAFGNNHSITWIVSGQDTDGNDLGGLPFGSFTTGSGGGGGGGSGTNAVTSFVVSKVWQYNQSSTAPPTLDTDYPYLFSATTILASNRTATAITLTLPTAAVSNLVQNFLEPEDYYLVDYDTNLATLNATYPAGDYVFDVISNTANQQVTVNLPAGTQPNAPQVFNYTAAQAVDPTQPFTLTWNTFTNGGSADYIFVNIGNVFQTPDYGQTNALNGTATSVVIPAGALQANSNYDAVIGFYHGAVLTNSEYATEGYLATRTQFSVATAGSVGLAPVLVNAAWKAGTFGFDIQTSPGQTVTVVYNTNLGSPFASWPVLLTTNSPGSIVHITAPPAAAAKAMFYGARNGN